MVFYGNEPPRYGVVTYLGCGARLYNSPIRIGRPRTISPGTGKLAMEEGTALLAVFHGVLRAPKGESLAWLAEQVLP